MKHSELKFPHDTKRLFVKRCVIGAACYGSDQIFYDNKKEIADIVRAILRKSTDTEDFIERYLADDRLANTQAYAAIIEYERPARRWKEIRAMFGERCFKTESDAGAVKVGVPGFTTMIRNGRGDGITRCAVFGKDEPFNRSFFNGCFETALEGTFNIYAYDCGDAVSRIVTGRFDVYSYDGLVAFVEY